MIFHRSAHVETGPAQRVRSLAAVSRMQNSPVIDMVSHEPRRVMVVTEWHGYRLTAGGRCKINFYLSIICPLPDK